MNPSIDQIPLYRSTESVAQQDRRRFPRQECSVPLVVIPIRDDGFPGDLHWADAVSVDLSATGLGFMVKRSTNFESESIVIGADNAVGTRAFATLKIQSQSQTGDGQLRIGGSWQINSEFDVLQSDKLRPQLDPQSLRFRYGWPELMLAAWTQLGVMRKYLVDRILVCDQCQSLPSWRYGCKTCGSGRIHKQEFLSHQICQYTGPLHEFEQGDELTCPNCKVATSSPAELVPVSSSVECFDCGSRDSTATMSALCHGCQNRFRAEDAMEQSLHAYHVERLDPLSLNS